jgi:two-component system OmpR family sensor kinase
MPRDRKLSLRGRMLVMLVAVTVVLLLIMGTVSAYLVTTRAHAQTASGDQRLSAAATILASRPQLAQGQSATGYAAVEVPLAAPAQVISLTAGPVTAQLADAVDQWLKRPAIASVVSLGQQGRRGRAVAQLRALGCQQLPRAGCKPVQLAPGLEVVSRYVPVDQAMLFVGQDVSTSNNQVRGFVLAELVTGLSLIVLLALGGAWLIGRGLEPLDEMTRTANQITSRGDLTARMPDAGEATEIGRLGGAINTMLDRIQQAFTSRLRSEQKVREFAADASHELRTPLTTIRGYAELYRQGALGPDQLPNAMRRIEQESQRMSMLVAELLELARLDRTSSLDLAETDLASLVRDAVADAIAVEPGRPVRAAAPPHLLAMVDEARIRQVLANLLGNVREHTPPGTPAVVAVGERRGGVLLEVTDAGPGMSAQDAARAFDRFHRGADRLAGLEKDQDLRGNGADWATVPYPVAVARGGGGAAESARSAARSHGEPAEGPGPDQTSGSGLGLSIVEAIAAAHGGSATLESADGMGTRVRVWLPVRVVS